MLGSSREVHAKLEALNRSHAVIEFDRLIYRTADEQAFLDSGGFSG